VKSTIPNIAFISALLCGSVIGAIPAFAAGHTGGQDGGTATENTADGTIETTTRPAHSTGYRAAGKPNNSAEANSGASVSTGGVSAGGDINSPDASNNAGSVDNSTRTSTGKLAPRAAH
jgi:hypothetical protein